MNMTRPTNTLAAGALAIGLLFATMPAQSASISRDGAVSAAIDENTINALRITASQARAIQDNLTYRHVLDSDGGVREDYKERMQRAIGRFSPDITTEIVLEDSNYVMDKALCNIIIGDEALCNIEKSDDGTFTIAELKEEWAKELRLHIEKSDYGTFTIAEFKEEWAKELMSHVEESTEAHKLAGLARLFGKDLNAMAIRIFGVINNTHVIDREALVHAGVFKDDVQKTSMGR